ncbi:MULTISPECIES: 5-oxoprolinase subunit PxpB [unclassified Pseudoalteromonas]|uniref:5-oxoprolinase subunit PxpB n=1 Tax=unclassified Pseudoalteromonas TaxID=194690 RepID=UPI00301453F8
MSDIQCYLLGENALVVELTAHSKSDNKEAQKPFALQQWLAKSSDFIDIVPAERSVTAYLKPGCDSKAWQAAILEHWPDLEVGELEPNQHTIAVDYSDQPGSDLTTVAAELGLSEQEVIALHSGAEYQVQFIGFLPGFAYLSGLPSQLQLPRKTTPATKVAKGSVAIAGAYSAIYPTESPGGWHVLGITHCDLFDPHSDSVSLLQPGDKVRFIAKEQSC